MKLTDRERAVLHLLTEGHCPESAAACLGISYQVAKNYLRYARAKNAMPTYQLVAIVAVEDYKRGLKESAPSGVPRD